MIWNYRVIKYDTNKNVVYRIHEVFYNENKEIKRFTKKPVFPQGESLKELISDLRLMIKDAEKNPILSLKRLNKNLVKNNCIKIQRD